MTLMLAVTRRAIEGADVLARGEFTGWCRPDDGRGFARAQAGIVGWAGSARAMARRSRALDSLITITTAARQRGVERELEATYWTTSIGCCQKWTSSRSNCPYSPATYHLFSAERLKRNEALAYLINTRAGEIRRGGALPTRLPQARSPARSGCLRSTSPSNPNCSA